MFMDCLLIYIVYAGASAVPGGSTLQGASAVPGVSALPGARAWPGARALKLPTGLRPPATDPCHRPQTRPTKKIAILA